MKLTGQMGVPVIVIDGQPIIGFDRARIQSLVSTGNGGRPHFGIKIADASSITRKQGKIPVFGAIIGHVASGSLGEKAGLIAGDIITEINANRVNNAADAEKLLGRLNSGSIVTIIFLRGDDTRKSEIVV